jgi:heat shock protein HslJ
MSRLALALVFSLTACVTPIYSQTDPVPKGEWHLIAIDGRIAPADAKLVFGDNGTVSGNAPCNGWSARNSAIYPAFQIERLRSTKRACDDLAEEDRFFESLIAMKTATIEDETHLILKGPDGRTMEFSTFALKADPNCRTCPHIRWEKDAPAPKG